MSKLSFSIVMFELGFLTNSVFHKANVYNVTILSLMVMILLMYITLRKRHVVDEE